MGGVAGWEHEGVWMGGLFYFTSSFNWYHGVATISDLLNAAYTLSR